jgi:hypothetical protein
MRENRVIARLEMMEAISTMQSESEARAELIMQYLTNTPREERVPFAQSVYDAMREDGINYIELNDIKKVIG